MRPEDMPRQAEIPELPEPIESALDLIDLCVELDVYPQVSITGQDGRVRALVVTDDPALIEQLVALGLLGGMAS